MAFTAGQRVLASDLNTATQQGAWTSYTMTWASTGTAVSLGNGSKVGFYAKVGRLVTVRAAVYAGSTTTFGTGDFSFTLPFTAAVTSAPTGQFVCAGQWILDNNGATFYTAGATILQSTPTIVNGIVNASGSFFGATNPVAWTAASTSFTVTITYESTS